MCSNGYVVAGEFCLVTRAVRTYFTGYCYGRKEIVLSNSKHCPTCSIASSIITSAARLKIHEKYCFICQKWRQQQGGKLDDNRRTSGRNDQEASTYISE